MAQKKKTSSQSESGIPVLEGAQLAGFDFSPWLARAKDMLVARPGLTLGIAAGAGFLLGLSVVSKVGRVLLVGAMGVGADLLQKRMKTAFFERDDMETMDAAEAS